MNSEGTKYLLAEVREDVRWIVMSLQGLTQQHAESITHLRQIEDNVSSLSYRVTRIEEEKPSIATALADQSVLKLALMAFLAALFSAGIISPELLKNAM